MYFRRNISRLNKQAMDTQVRWLHSAGCFIDADRELGSAPKLLTQRFGKRSSMKQFQHCACAFKYSPLVSAWKGNPALDAEARFANGRSSVG